MESALLRTLKAAGAEGRGEADLIQDITRPSLTMRSAGLSRRRAGLGGYLGGRHPAQRNSRRSKSCCAISYKHIAARRRIAQAIIRAEAYPLL